MRVFVVCVWVCVVLCVYVYVLCVCCMCVVYVLPVYCVCMLYECVLVLCVCVSCGVCLCVPFDDRPRCRQAVQVNGVGCSSVAVTIDNTRMTCSLSAGPARHSLRACIVHRRQRMSL